MYYYRSSRKIYPVCRTTYYIIMVRSIFAKLIPLFIMATLIAASNFFAISLARASRDRECREYGALLDQIKQDEVRARKNNPECPRCLCVDTVAQSIPPSVTMTKRAQTYAQQQQRASSRIVRTYARHTTRVSLWARMQANERAFRKKFDRAYFRVLSSVRKMWYVTLRAIYVVLPYIIGCIIGTIIHRGIITITIERTRDFMRNIRYHDE